MARWTNVYADPGTKEVMNVFLATTNGLDSTFEWDEPDDCDMRKDDEDFFFLYVVADNREAEIALESFCEISGYETDGWEDLED